jgi:integrase
MAAKKALKRFTGVYYTESTVKKWRDRPDRCYWVNFKKDGKLFWERCGWASEGWTPESAQRRRYEILDQERVGDYKPKRERKQAQLTFSTLMLEYYLPWSRQNHRQPRDNEYRYEKWLRPLLGNKTLKEISPMDLERIKKTMRDAGRSDATIRHVLGIVRQAFNMAMKWGLWEGGNPAKLVTFPRSDNKRQRFLSPQEARTLLEELRARSPQLARIAALSLYGGLRLGEILKLEWGDVDFDNGLIHIRDTKSGDSRVIYITHPIHQILEELSRGEPTALIFQTPKGQPIRELSKTFDRVVKARGV